MGDRPRPTYGIDAPVVLTLLGAAGVLFTLAGVILAFAGGGWWWLWLLADGLFFLASCAIYLHTTRRGKFVVWTRLLAQVPATGRERVVDLGCGRGAVLTMAARLVPAGRAIGVDLWRSVDQSGNDPATTLHNADAEGVVVDLLTADMRALPVATAAVDLVVSSLAIHNIPDAQGRLAAIAEAARILRPGGRLLIADFRHTREYAEELTRLGLRDVAVRPLGWRFWYGGPWGATSLVTAVR